MKKMIYLDTASTTPVRKEVILAMKPYWDENYGNPSSIIKMGVKARQAVEDSRKTVAEYLSSRANEIFFTSGGTESNNLAIFGLVNRLEEIDMKIPDMHFITTNIEHGSITRCFKELERKGAKVDYLAVKDNGIIESKDLRKIIRPNTVLVSVGYANNEIGTIQPIKEIAKEVRHARKIGLTKHTIRNNFPLFHTDASQAGLYLNLNINELGIDLMTLDAQKVYGPKGAGVLFVKAGVKISPTIFGGGQEKGLRSGTENVPLIVGQAKALEIARKDFQKKAKRASLIRDYFWKKIQKNILSAIINGDLENRLPNNLNISIPGIDSEFTVFCLDEMGIACSTKSACNYKDDESFVVQALGKGDDIARSMLRFSLGEEVSKKDIDWVVLTLKNIIINQEKHKYI